MQDKEDRQGGGNARRGSGKVTAGHGRSRRSDAKRGGAKRPRADADEKRRRQNASDNLVGARTSASVARQRRTGDAPRKANVSDEVMRPSGASGGRPPAPTGQSEKTSRLEDQAGQAPEPADRSDGTEIDTSAQLREGPPAVRIRDRSWLSEKMAHSTRLRLWLQSSALDFALVLVVSVALVYTISYGFYSAETYRSNTFLVTGLIAPLLMALFAGSWSKRAVAVSAIACALLSGAYIAAAFALSSDQALFGPDGVNDSPGNYTIFAMVLCITTIVTYLLSRRTVGLVFLLVFGVVSCGLVQFLWREWITDLSGIPAFIAVFLGIGMLFIYQCYKQSVYSANRAKRTSFLGAFAYSALIGLVCVAVGAGVFACVEAIAPGTISFKPFESHVSPPVDEMANTYEKMDEENDEETDQTNDEEQLTSDRDEGGQDSGVGGFGFFENTLIQGVAQGLAGYNPDDPEQDYENIAYQVLAWELMITALLVLLIVLAVVLLWRYRRTLRLKRIEKESPSYQAWYLYTFLLERFRRLKLAKPEHLTPLEFAVGFSKPMLPFTRGTNGTDFVDVSIAYQDAAMGGVPPTEAQLGQMKDYYKAFFKNARSYVGLPKWIVWKFWRI